MCILACAFPAKGQLHPFPQHTQYTPGAIKPNTVSQSALDDSTRAFYDRWKARFLIAGCTPGQYYISTEETDSTLCVSEGHGYGMLITALMAGYDPDARQYFDGLFQWFHTHKSAINGNLMAWRQYKGCYTPSGTSSATDGDLDIAHALLLAHEQWGSAGTVDYLTEALQMISAIKQSEVNPARTSVELGDWVSPSNSTYYYGTRTSDFMTDHFRAFRAFSGDSTWSTVIDTCYSFVETMQANYSPATGLLPNFIYHLDSSPAPAPPNFLESTSDGFYAYNACRDPLRLGVDYLLHGDQRAKTAVQKINDWMKTHTGGDPSLIHSGYKLDGTDITGNNYSDAAFTAPLMAGAMVDPSNQAWLNSLWSFNESYTFSSQGYYQNTLKMLSMIAVSGNWWAPEISNGVPSLLVPTDNAVVAELPLILRWDSFPGAANYQVQIAVDPTFSALFVNDSSLVDTTASYQHFANQTYYWRVRAGDGGGGASSWSETRRFTVTGAIQWNLISIPLKVPDGSKTLLFPDAISDAYASDPATGYIRTDTLHPGPGYWLKIPTNDIFLASGDTIAADTIPVAQGWNLVGSIGRVVPATHIISDPPSMSTSQFFGYGSRYFISDSILPSHGYWVKCSSSGKLILSIFSQVKPVNRIRIVATEEMPPPPPTEDYAPPPEAATPASYALEQNYPNPFNPTTDIGYRIPDMGFVTLIIYDMLGRETATLVNEVQAKGRHEVSFTAGSMGGGLPSGIYFYRLTVTSITDPIRYYNEVRKAVLIK